MNKTSISLLLCAAMMVGDILRKIPLCLGYQKTIFLYRCNSLPFLRVKGGVMSVLP